jgi:Rho-binding antiterminator
MPKEYIPINCSFYDILEAAATQKRKVEICIMDEEGTKCFDAIIVNLITQSGEEFMIVDNGDSIKLDKILRVDGHALHDFDNPCGI